MCINISDRDRHKLYVHTNKHKMVIVILHGKVHGIVRGMGTLMQIRWGFWYGHGNVPEEVRSKLRYELFIRKNKNKTEDVKIPSQNSLEKISREHVRITDCLISSLLISAGCLSFYAEWSLVGTVRYVGSRT